MELLGRKTSFDVFIRNYVSFDEFHILFHMVKVELSGTHSHLDPLADGMADVQKDRPSIRLARFCSAQ